MESTLFSFHLSIVLLLMTVASIYWKRTTYIFFLSHQLRFIVFFAFCIVGEKLENRKC